MTKTRVFLSYARADDDPDHDDASKSFMRRLYDDLTKADFEVWWDRESMPSRDEVFTKEIEKAIAQQDRFLLVVGANIHKPEGVENYVRAEWEYALSLCKPITPILLNGDFSLIPEHSRNKHAVDFRDQNRFTERFAELQRILRDDVLPLGDTYGVDPLPTGFINRDSPYNTARDSLLQDEIQATVVSATVQTATSLYGPGGVGKSTLATAIGRDCAVRRRFTDGVIWVKVGQKAVPTQLQSAIGVTVYKDSPDNYKTERDGWLALSQILKGKKALIILDDVWEHELVEHLPVADTGCRLLITTRSATLAANIDGLDVRLDVLTPEEGARLIAARVGGGEQPIYLQISQELNGHTLAVALAAARLKKRGAAYAQTILEGLKNTADPFLHLAVHPQDKNLNLSKSLALSYDALTPEQQKQFRQLGVFAVDSTFPLDALAALWGENLTNADLQAEALCDACLLDHNPDTGRYSQHRVLRAYARALLTEAGEMNDAFSYYADWVIQAAPFFDTRETSTWSKYEPIIPHILYVGDILTETDADTLADRQAALLWKLRDFFFIRGEMLYLNTQTFSSRLEWYKKATLHMRKTKQYIPLSTIFFSLSGLYEREGKWEEALKILHESLEIVNAVNDKRSIALAIGFIADLYVHQGRLDDALDFYFKSLGTMEKLHDKREIALIKSKIADIYVNSGRWDEAMNLYTESLEIMQEFNDVRSYALIKSSIANLHLHYGKLQDALVIYEEVLEVMIQLDDSSEISTCQSCIADIYCKKGEWDRALIFYYEALKKQRFINNLKQVAITQRKIANLYFQRNQLDEALELYKNTLEINRNLNSLSQIAFTQHEIADVYVQQGNLDDAIKLYYDSLEIKIKLNDLLQIAITKHSIGDVYVQQGRWDEALELYKASLKIKKELNDFESKSITEFRIAKLYTRMEKWDEALKFYKTSLETNQKLDLAYNVILMNVRIKDEYGEALILSRKDITHGLEMMWNSYLKANEFKFIEEIQEIKKKLKIIKKHLGIVFDSAWAKRIFTSQPKWLAKIQLTPQQAQEANMLTRLKPLYDQSGVDAMRGALLQQGVPAEVVEDILARLAAM